MASEGVERCRGGGGGWEGPEKGRWEHGHGSKCQKSTVLHVLHKSCSNWDPYTRCYCISGIRGLAKTVTAGVLLHGMSLSLCIPVPL